MIRYDIIYFVLGALISRYVHNGERRKDLLGNAYLGSAYTCAALMVLYPEHLIFGLGFALFTVSHNIGVQVEDFEYDTVRTVPKQFNKIMLQL